MNENLMTALLSKSRFQHGFHCLQIQKKRQKNEKWYSFSPSSVRSGQSDRRCGPRELRFFASSSFSGPQRRPCGSPRAWPNSESLRRHAIEMAGPGQKMPKNQHKNMKQKRSMKLKRYESISLKKRYLSIVYTPAAVSLT